jgi:hypothetical protein
MISATTRGWLFVGVGTFFVVATLLLAGSAVLGDPAALFQLSGGTLLLGTGVGYVLGIGSFARSIVTTIFASAGFAAGFVGFVGIFTL